MSLIIFLKKHNINLIFFYYYQAFLVLTVLSMVISANMISGDTFDTISELYNSGGTVLIKSIAFKHHTIVWTKLTVLKVGKYWKL